MLVRIAVADPLPLFRHGVVQILRDAGFQTETPDDLLAWVHDQQVKAAVMTLHSEADWHVLELVHRTKPETVIVAVLERPSVETCVRALRAGATCAVPRDATPSTLREAFAAAVQGRSLVSVEVLRALMESDATPVPYRPSHEEGRWLRELSRGMTVGRLAAEVGYSERMMFRLLRDLYVRMGASNRTDALIVAQAKGWL